MISRKLKSAYYALLSKPMQFNAFFYRSFMAPTRGTAKVQLGPGQKNYLQGWINVDANLFTAKHDVWADIRHKLPFRNNSIDVFYSHHVIEHLPDVLLPYHFQEMFRCLKPNGIIRVGGPHGDNAAAKLIEGDAGWFPDWPDKRNSAGGRFVNFIFCRGEHLTILTFSYLSEIARQVGFRNVRLCKPAIETHHPCVIDMNILGGKEWERTPDCPHTLIIEAEKSSS